jgi:hypothetical protein
VNILVRPILLVEDNPMDVDLMRRALAKGRVPNPIQVARDGEEAISMINRWDAGEEVPLIILLDLKLPKVDGLDILQRYKTHPTYHVIPVVILTTSSEERDIQSAYMGGANSYIVKPVDFDEFIQAVSQIEYYWCKLNVLPPVERIIIER